MALSCTLLHENKLRRGFDQRSVHRIMPTVRSVCTQKERAVIFLLFPLRPRVVQVSLVQEKFSRKTFLCSCLAVLADIGSIMSGLSDNNRPGVHFVVQARLVQRLVRGGAPLSCSCRQRLVSRGETLGIRHWPSSRSPGWLARDSRGSRPFVPSAHAV